jgi:CRP-like cAMP-binding protein
METFNPVKDERKKPKLASFDFFAYLIRYYDLFNRVESRQVAEGDFIYNSTDTLHYMYEVVTGAVKIGTYTNDGEIMVYDVLGPGEFFGNLKYLNGGFFEFSKAAVGCEIRCYELTFFKRIINEDPVLADWFHYYLVKRWCEAETRLVKMKSKKIEDKVNFLREKYATVVKTVDGKSLSIFNLLTKQELGDLIGVSRQTLSKALKK